jgi:ribosome maturation factor RimP
LDHFYSRLLELVTGTEKNMRSSVDPIRALIEPSVQALGYDLVRIRITGSERPTLQIMAERSDGTMNVDDCAVVSRAVSALLDVEDPIAGKYDLEVSSPGIDRPLVRERDFERWAGFDVKIELVSAVGGQKRFRGRLMGLRDGNVVLLLPDGERELVFDDVESAKLVMSDELIAAHSGH